MQVMEAVRPKKMSKGKPKKILNDHKRIGKRFVPPLIHKLGPLRETPWIDVTMPELIWIACLIYSEGVFHGTDLALALSKGAHEIRSDSPRLFAGVSSFKKLSAEEKERLAKQLTTQEKLSQIQRALSEFQFLYPDSPFEFCFPDGVTPPEDVDKSLCRFKEILTSLFDKTSKEAVMVQGAAVYFGFANGKLTTSPDTSLADFPQLEYYPDTEKSRLVASAVRAALPLLLLDPEKEYQTDWAKYFWNRGLQLEKCEEKL
jgi:hypothetical protein